MTESLGSGERRPGEGRLPLECDSLYPVGLMGAYTVNETVHSPSDRTDATPEEQLG
jgi:hypothetical protein